MDVSLPKDQRDYTYKDYISWSEDSQIEIIDGTLYIQAAPSRLHQEVLSELHRQIANFLFDKNCKVYPTPFSVTFDFGEAKKQDIKNVVEPDLSIVCDLEKLDEHGCKGSPDMIIEVISPSTARVDKIEKFNLYEKAQVKEYWIVEPQEKIVSVFTLQANGKYGRPDLYTEEDHVNMTILKDLQINLDHVFT